MTAEDERHDLAVRAIRTLKEIGEDESAPGMARVKAASTLLHLSFPGTLRHQR